MIEKGEYEDITKEVGVVLIGHGSVLPYNEQMMLELKRKIEKKGIFNTVRVAFIQINSPGIEDVLKNLIEEGVKNIVVLPVFLAKGVHTVKDIPNKLKRFYEDVREEDMDVKIIYGGPIGADDRVVEVLRVRIKEVMEKEWT